MRPTSSIARSLLSAKVFQELYNTFQGDQTSKAKIRGRAIQLGVHPDAAESCTEMFVSSLITAGLASVEADGMRLIPATQLDVQVPERVSNGPEDDIGEDGAPSSGAEPRSAEAEEPAKAEQTRTQNENGAVPRPRTAADVTINLSVDSSMDFEKLEKHLALLRRYSLI